MGWCSRTVAVLAIVSVSCVGEGGRRQFMSLGTAGTGGIYYPLGGAIANRLSQIDSSRQYTAEVTGGSVENLNRVAQGEMDLGMSIALTAYEAYNGGTDYPEPMTGLRLIAPLYANVTHILASPGSGVAALTDFRDRRISVGPPGSGTEQVARIVLNAVGMSYDDVNVRYLSFRESADALRDGAIDGAFVSAGYPAAAVLEATTNRSAVLVGIPDDVARVLAEEHAYFEPGVIPADAYPRMSEAVSTVTTLNWIVGTDQLDAEVVGHVLTVLREQRSELERVHPIAAQIDLGVLDGELPIPLHDAVRAVSREP